GAVAAENTHNAAGGKVMSPAVMAGIVSVAQQAELPVHLDGARLWNAAAALGVPLAQLARGAATVMVSFSKGLGCPVGSCLAFAGRRLRAVTHLDVSRQDVERAAGVITRVLAE